MLGMDDAISCSSRLDHLSAPGQGWLATLVTMCGGKPLWDTYHTMFDKPIKGDVDNAFVRVLAKRVLRSAFCSLIRSVVSRLPPCTFRHSQQHGL